MAEGQAGVEEVPPGYKRTEAGVVPEEWEIEILSKIADVKTGPFGSSLHQRDYVEDGTPIITVEHLSERGIVHDNLPLVSDSDWLRLRSYTLRQGDIVFSRVGSVDRNSLVSEAEGGWLFSGRLLRVRVSDHTTHPPYLSYHFHSEPFKQRIHSFAVGQTMASLNTQILKEMHTVLPPLPEQRAIAGALSDVDGLIGALDALIEKKRAIMQAAMQQLLTAKKRLPGFEGEWEVKRLGDIITFLPTANKPRADLSDDGEIQYIHYGDVHAQTKPVLDCNACTLPYIDRKKVGNAAYLEDNDLVIVDASEDLDGTGKSIEIHGISGKNVIAGLHTIACRGIPEQWAKGFKAYLQFIPAFRSALTRVATGISVFAISKKQISEIRLALPSVPEQEAIVSILSDMDAGIAALERRRDKVTQIKQGMMQELLTGRTRLIDPPEAPA